MNRLHPIYKLKLGTRKMNTDKIIVPLAQQNYLIEGCKNRRIRMIPTI